MHGMIELIVELCFKQDIKKGGTAFLGLNQAHQNKCFKRLNNVFMQTIWHRYISKLFLGNLPPHPMKAILMHHSQVHQCEIIPVHEENVKFPILNTQFLFCYRYSENKKVSESGMARIFRGRRSKWKRSWGHDENLML